MINHRQLIEHDPENGRYGDCHRTCIASILNLPPEVVPHFLDGDAADWRERQTEWLGRHGLAMASWYYDGSTSLDDILSLLRSTAAGAPLILGGRSSIGSNHSVVIMDGAIACDPSGNGIVGPMDDGYWWITAITIADHWMRAPARLQRSVAHG